MVRRARPLQPAVLPATELTVCAAPQNYEEALRIAEAREREVRGFFDKFDVDGSGTIDMEEMGLLKNLKTDRITFCSEMFVKYDANDDGVLRRSFATKAAPAPNTASASHPRAQL